MNRFEEQGRYNGQDECWGEMNESALCVRYGGRKEYWSEPES